MEVNELSKNAKGGTELMMERVHQGLGLFSDVKLDDFQIIPSRVREIDPNKKTILWLHDLPEDPESRHLASTDLRERFDKIVFVSDWQKQRYMDMYGIAPSECVVIPNGIEPIEVSAIKSTDKIRLIYHTTPHRGLEILVPVFKELCNHFDNIHLDVYSSFSIYGWEERDKPYEKLFEECRNHEHITYHGAVSNDEIREALKKSHIFAYPNIWTETSCLAAIEAMSAKNLIVCPNKGALPETCGAYAIMYQENEDMQQHAELFFRYMYTTIKNYQYIIGAQLLNKQADVANYRNNISLVIQKWHNLLREIS